MRPFEQVERFIALMQRADTIGSIQAIVGAELQALGFDRFFYLQLHLSKGRGDRVMFGTYPPDWSRHYALSNLRLHDPLWGHGFKTVQPFLWETVRAAQRNREAERLVYGPGEDAGLRSGAGIPLHGPLGGVATLYVSNDCAPGAFRELFESQQHALQLVAFNTHARVIELSPPAVSEPSVGLSARQKDVLLWMAHGKTNWEIGELLGISEDTVRQHVIKICRLLGASNRSQAAVIAVMQGLIVP